MCVSNARRHSIHTLPALCTIACFFSDTDSLGLYGHKFFGTYLQSAVRVVSALKTTTAFVCHRGVSLCSAQSPTPWSRCTPHLNCMSVSNTRQLSRHSLQYVHWPDGIRTASELGQACSSRFGYDHTGHWYWTFVLLLLFV